jgi:hypothetical protein
VKILAENRKKNKRELKVEEEKRKRSQEDVGNGRLIKGGSLSERGAD